MKRRLFSLFLALTLVVGMLPAPAFAQETESTQATQAPTEASTPTEAPRAEPTQAPTEAPTEAPAAEPTQPVTEAQPTEPPVPAFTEPARDEAVAAVQAMIDALPDVEDMSESYLDALEAAYSAFDALSEAQQAQINGVEKLEALFGWVNSQVSTLADDVKEISGVETWNNQTFTTPIKLTGETTLTLTGTNRIKCDQPLDLNGFDLTIQGTGTLEVVGDGRSKEYQCNGAIFDSTYTGRTASAGTLILESGTVKASGGKYNAISLYAVDLKGGSLEAYGGVRSGLACSYLYARSGSIYATGGEYGIYAAVFRGACNPGNLPILASDEKDASMAEMDEGNLDDINDNAYKKTYYIGKVTGPMLSIKAQKGYLYEGTADQTATFSYSAKNLDGCMFGVEWTGAHPGLAAEFSLSVDQTIIVTTKDAVKRGTYELKLIARDAESAKTLATKTFTVTVLGGPITVTTQPQDASVSCKRGDLDAWQGDKKIQVSAKLAAGLTGDITYQWKLEDGTELDNCTGYELFLQDLFVGGKLPQVADQPWLSSAKVYCTLTCGSHSVDTNAVTLTVNTCAHERANPDGNCQQCGEPCSSEPLLVRGDGLYYLIANEEQGEANVGHFMYSGGNFYLTGDVPNKIVNVSCTDGSGKDVTLDLQEHTMGMLRMGNFPYGTFTVKNGTLNQCVYSDATEGKLILDGVTFMAAYATNNSYLDITVQGESVFKEKVSFSSVEGVVHLRGGTFEKGIDTSNGAQPLKLLADGYAFKSDRGIVDASIPENLNGKTIQVVEHKCNYVNGKCECGRSCDHPKMDSTTGKCTVCGLFQATASVAAGGTTTYFADFGAALEAAKSASGSTLTLFRDVALTGENKLYIDSGTFTIDWNGHTISGEMSNDLLVITGTAKVTLTDSVGTGTTGGLRNVGGAAIGVYYGGGLTVQGGVYSPQLCKYESAYGSIQISGGRFENPEDGGRNGALYCDTGSLAGLLAPGYTFAYEDDDSLFDVYGAKKSGDYRTVYVVEHQEHEFDEDGQCSCGYLCPHDEVDEAGECTLCGKRFYVQGTYANGTTHYYGTISDALEDPAVTQATILRALTEECESWNGGDRSVTLDLNGWNLVVESIQGGHLILRDSSGIGSILAVKEIQKDGQVSVESGRLAPQGETLSVYGKLTVTGGKVDSLTAMEGSTVSLSGGSFGKIVGSGVTLKELLAEDCYYAELDGETPKNYADTDTVLEQVSVKPCDHTSVRENKGTYFTTYTCNCGKVTYLLTVTVGESDKKYFGDYNTGFAYAAKSDGVVRFLELNGTIEVNTQGMVTIDMENRSYSANGRSLVIKSGSTVQLVGQGTAEATPEAGGGSSSGSSGTRRYGEFIPVTVEAGGTFVLPANNLNGEPNMAKPTQLTVQSGGTAELQGGSTQWTDVYGTLKISGGSHLYIHQYEKGQLNITGGQIQLLLIYGDLPQNALSGGSYVTISVMEFRSGETEKFRDVTFADFQKMLVSGKVFQKKQDQSYPNEVEETPNYGTFNYKKELNKVNVTAAPFTGVQVVCQLGADTYEEKVSTQYNVGETDSSGNVVFRLGVNIQSQEAQPGVTVQWYQLGAEDSRTPVGTGLTCPLDLRLPVGTHRFLAVVNCSGYVLESQPFAVTVTPRVVNITGGFTAQDRDYELDNPSVQIIQGEVTFDKKAEEDDLSAQVHGGTIATPDAGQNRTVDYSVTLTGEDKDNYTLGSKPELTVTIRPIAQTLAFAETAVTKTYGDSPFVNALTHSVGDGQITYTSSDPAVATVGTEGTVTIRGAGEARITATAAATQNYVETAASFDLTVAKATGTVRNRNYSLGYLYGDDIPTPERKYFEASSTGAFRYSWSPAAPKNAGNYQLTVTVDEDGNYTSATLVLNVLVEKDVWVRPTLVKAENETVDGKKDGKVTYTDTPALEYRIKCDRGEWIPVAVPAGAESVTVEGLAPGTYEFRRPGDENHFASSPETITIQPGPKLTVTLPDKQEGYTLTASKTQLGWHEDVELTFQLDSVGVYKAADFGIWAEAGSEKTKLTLGNDGAVKLTAPEKDITITVTGVKTDDVAPKVYIQGRMSKDSFDYVKWEGFQENPADDFVNGNFAIAATDRLSGVASLWYCLSQTPLTLAEMDTASWKQAGKVSITEDGVYYLYAKALDNANNAGYACTGKLVKESNPPTFSGVENGKTYYVSQQMEIHDDGMPDWYMAKGSIGVVPNGGNENPIKLRLPNNGSPYTFTVGDRCGNEATITVYMKPLTDLTQPLDRIQEETIRKSDRATLDEVEATLKGLDVTYAFDSEKKEINDALARIEKLRQVLDQVAAVEAQIDALPDSVEPYQQTVEDTQIKPARQAYSDLTDHQKALVDSTKLDKLVRLEAQLNAWTITEGDGQIWYKGSGKSLSFTVNGQSRKFDGIRQGNTYIGSGVSSLLTASGEMDKPFTLTLKPEFLQCQTPGEHSFTVVYYSGLYSSGYLSISVTYTVETPANYLDVTNKPEFDGKTTVTIDGKEYPIEEMAGYLQRIPTQRYVNLPETGDLLTIYSFKDGTPTGSYTNYPMGMQVFRITRQEGGAKAEEITEFANLLNYAGCSIRVSGKKGIRMITGIDQNVKKSLVSKAGLAGYTLEEYGTVVQWADQLGSNTLNLDNSNKKNYAYKKGKADPIFAKVDGMIQYTNVLVGFTDAQCQPDLVMRPYIKLMDTATGETVTLYGGSVTRSIGYVAWQNRDTYKPGTASYKYVWNIINSVDTSKYPN